MVLVQSFDVTGLILATVGHAPCTMIRVLSYRQVRLRKHLLCLPHHALCLGILNNAYTVV